MHGLDSLEAAALLATIPKDCKFEAEGTVLLLGETLDATKLKAGEPRSLITLGSAAEVQAPKALQ